MNFQAAKGAYKLDTIEFNGLTYKFTPDPEVNYNITKFIGSLRHMA